MHERIADVMTAQPWTVHADDSLALAREMMAERGIGHLPVLDGGVAIGMVTARDLAAAGERLAPVSSLAAPVCCVPREAPLANVVDTMLAEHRDAVVVTDGDRVAGIFTTSDALRELALRLRDDAAGASRAVS